MKKSPGAIKENPLEQSSVDITACFSLWNSSARQNGELVQLIRVITERAFIAFVRPTTEQVSNWKVTGELALGLKWHVERIWPCPDLVDRSGVGV